MTLGVIALTRKMPDSRSVLAGLYAGGPELRVSSSAEGPVMHLHAEDGRRILTVDRHVNRLAAAAPCRAE